MSKPKGENLVGPRDAFSTLTNYFRNGTASIGFWRVANLLKYVTEVGFSQTEVENPTTHCFVLCFY